jgi:hypothetical protein
VSGTVALLCATAKPGRVQRISAEKRSGAASGMRGPQVINGKMITHGSLQY